MAEEDKKIVEEKIEKKEEKKKYPVGRHPNTLAALERHRHYLTDADRAKGTERSNRAKRNRRTFKKELEKFLSLPMSQQILENLNSDVLASLKDMGYDTKLTLNELLALSQIVNAVKGDNRAFENVRDTVGEKPVEKAEHSLFSEGINVVISDKEEE
jgi:hypothetical protein